MKETLGTVESFIFQNKNESHLPTHFHTKLMLEG